MNDLTPTKKRGSRLGLMLLVFGLLGFGGFVAFVSVRSGQTPEVKVTADLPAIGKKTTLTIVAQEPVRGLVSVEAKFVQAGRTTKLHELKFEPQPAYNPLGPMTAETTFEVVVGKDHQEGLLEGEATIVVEARGAGTWLSSVAPAKVEKTMMVKLRPPTLSVQSSHIYPTQGGAEAVVYTVGDSSVKDGVKVGRWFFPGYPLPGGGAQERFALFAVPYDHRKAAGIDLVAQDEVGNEIQMPFIDRFKPKAMRRDTINVSERVMKRLVTKIAAQTPTFKEKETLVDSYVAINREMRKANNQVLEDLAEKTQAKFFWNEAFVQMEAQVVSSFADRRTYRHNGKKIDMQDHLGFDLARVAKADVPAANHGQVVWADYLGIYGNTVVIDHGYGLMSLYAHLSKMKVKLGDVVTRAQVIGQTGTTGLALGDHLHFTMLLHGLPVNPLEWWDGHWIHDRLALKLKDALKFTSSN